MKMIFIFIDGFGLGDEDPGINPIAAANAPCIHHILKHYSIPTDATLEVPGLPQSATGQTAIFTGENASKALGKHLSGQPTVTLRKIIDRNNLFKELLKRGLRVTNANVYRDEYLEKMLDPEDRRHRPSVTSCMTLASGLKFRTIGDYKKGMGVYHDITGQIIKASGYDVEVITPKEAAERLYSISRENDFTLYEHFLTDIIGHMADMNTAVAEIELLDAFLGRLLELVNLEEDIILMTSDHGNIEDITLKTHTMNKVPTILLGKIPEKAKVEVRTIMDIVPLIKNLFDARETENG